IAKPHKSITVVGDDDQGLYRFRGATIELFTGFPSRLQKKLSITSPTRFLNDNYRSAKPIVDLVNAYANLDASFRSVRVKNKPTIRRKANFPQPFPIPGLFRNTPEALAQDLAALLHDVFRGPGRNTPGAGLLIKKPNGGDLGDCCLLSSSPREFAGDR